MGAHPILTGGGVSPQSIHESSTAARHAVGTRAQLTDGRVFYYTKVASSAALDPGKRVQAETIPSTRANLAAAAAAAGASSVTVTLGALLASANDYAEGYLHVNDVDGEGHTYKIREHAAIGSGGTGAFVLYDEVVVALTANSQVTLQKNPWSDVVIGAGAKTNMTVGVAPITLPASSYGWLQTWGSCAGWDSAATAIGDSIATSGTAGKFAVGAEGAGTLGAVFGIQLYTGVDTEYYPKFLTIAP